MLSVLNNFQFVIPNSRFIGMRNLKKFHVLQDSGKGFLVPANIVGGIVPLALRASFNSLSARVTIASQLEMTFKSWLNDNI
jgi:hypothetical protein